MIHTNNTSATNMRLRVLSTVVSTAVQEHALHRYTLAHALQALYMCLVSWLTRATHPDPVPMPPAMSRPQKLVLVLVVEYSVGAPCS